MLKITPYNLYAYNNAPKISFSSYTKSTKVISDGKEINLDHKTEMFRNLETSNFIHDYAKENFPQGTTYSCFGASDGRTVYSNCVLFNDINNDGRYKFKGYDFAAPIKDANIGLYALEDYSKNEAILFPRKKKANKGGNAYFPNVGSNRKNDEIRNTFYEYFDEVIAPKKYRDTIIEAESPSGHRQLLTPDQVKRYREEVKNNRTLFVVPNTKKIKNSSISPLSFHTSLPFDKRNPHQALVTFSEGNILEIEKHVKPNSSGIIAFQNALYHIINSRGIEDYRDFKCPQAEVLFKKIHDILPTNGLFAMGTLYCEHLVDENIKPEHGYQNNKLIEIYKDSAVHKALKSAGFEPLFYEKLDFAKSFGLEDLHVPTIWKKIPSLQHRLRTP